MLMTLSLSACQWGSQWRGQQRCVEQKYIPLRATPYACPMCQKNMEKTLLCAYEHHRGALMAEQKALGDFGPQPDFFC